MRVAAIIPAHDEAAILEKNARHVWKWGRKAFGHGFTLVISENGSGDSTAWLARLLEKLLDGCVTLTSKTPGKGGAIKRASAAVEADAYLMLDADLSTDLDTAEALVAAVVSGADVAIASRRVPSARVRRPLVRKAATAVYAALAQAALGLGIRDLQCGCKAFSRHVRDEVLPTVVDDGFFFDTELLARSRSRGAKIDEIGAIWTERAEGGGGSKVRLLRDGLIFLKKLAALREDLR